MQTIRQSDIKNYLICNRMYQVGQGVETEPSEAMLNGLIFEGFLLGWHSETRKNELILTKTGKEKTSVARLKTLADKLKDRFFMGNPHDRITLQLDRDFQISGEPDYVGGFTPESDRINAIVDVKLTKDIPKIWDWKEEKHEFLQAVCYTWMVEETTGDRLPFYYFVVEDNAYEVPIVRIIHVEVTDEDINWFKSLVEKARNDIFLQPNTEKCLGRGVFDPRCRYLDLCEFGRGLVGGYNQFKFADLKCDIDVAVNENATWQEQGKKKKKVFDEKFMAEHFELEETPIQNFLFEQITMDISEFENGPKKCRNCQKEMIEKSDKHCKNCNVKIIIIGE